MGENKSNRLSYIDANKGISIFLVVLGHSLMNTARNIESEYAVLINFIAYLAVPSFFFINGYLYNHKYSLSPIKSIIKKFKAYYIPFVGFSLFFWMFHNVFVYLHLTSEAAYSAKDYFVRLIQIFLCHMESELNGAMWFLRALLIMVILYIFMDFFAMKIRNTTVRNIVLAIVVVLMLVIGKNRILPGVYNLNRIFESMQFFFLGVLIKEYKLDELISKYKVPVFAVGIIIMGITSVFFYGALGVDEGYKDILGNLCGIVGLFALSMFKPVQESKLLALLGKASLDIMSLHFLAFKVVSYALIVIYGMNIERLSELPVLKGTHGIAVILYLVVGLGLCTIEYLIRNKICIKMKENK